MNLTRLIVGMIALLILTTEAVAKMKPITGKPVIDAPELLEWPYDHDTVTPNLNDPTSNTLHDFHSEISSCDLVLSSEGNYYPAQGRMADFPCQVQGSPAAELVLHYKPAGGPAAN